MKISVSLQKFARAQDRAFEWILHLFFRVDAEGHAEGRPWIVWIVRVVVVPLIMIEILYVLVSAVRFAVTR